jgi:hypothetical protein
MVEYFVELPVATGFVACVGSLTASEFTTSVYVAAVVAVDVPELEQLLLLEYSVATTWKVPPTAPATTEACVNVAVPVWKPVTRTQPSVSDQDAPAGRPLAPGANLT